MAAKTKAQRENLSFFEDDGQTDSSDDTQPELTPPNEILLSSSDPEARELFDLSTQVKDLKPWRWMEETDLIGIEHPETGEIGFICGTHPARKEAFRSVGRHPEVEPCAQAVRAPRDTGRRAGA